MRGKITFHFDDGFRSHYEIVFKLFKQYNAVGCLALSAKFRPENAMSNEQALEMQSAGWEIMSHGTRHSKLNEYNAEMGIEEIAISKQLLSDMGFEIGQFITPCSECNIMYQSLLEKNYHTAFTVYTNSKELPIEELVIKKPISNYALNRACLSGKTIDELRAYVDFVSDHDAWLNFYEHDIAAGENITEDTLSALLMYCKEKEVHILTVASAIEK